MGSGWGMAVHLCTLIVVAIKRCSWGRMWASPCHGRKRDREREREHVDPPPIQPSLIIVLIDLRNVGRWEGLSREGRRTPDPQGIPQRGCGFSDPSGCPAYFPTTSQPAQSCGEATLLIVRPGADPELGATLTVSPPIHSCVTLAWLGSSSFMPL